MTSTPHGFRLPSSKLRVIGQGVNVDRFSLCWSPHDRRDLVYVGRVSARKRVDLLVRAMSRLKRIAPDAGYRLRIIGPTLTADDRAYSKELVRLIDTLELEERVLLEGPATQQQTADVYQQALLHVNVSRTGSLDKTMVEALACGCPVVTSNEACFELLNDFPEMCLSDDRPHAIAERIAAVARAADRYDPQVLRGLVVGKHDLDAYVGKLLGELCDLRTQRAAA